MDKTQPPPNTDIKKQDNINYKRLDVVVSKKLNSSRARAKEVILGGFVSINNEIISKVSFLFNILNDSIKIDNKCFSELNLIKAQKQTKKLKKIQEQKQNIDKPPYDIKIIYEDDDILVVNKPYGVVTHGGDGVAYSAYTLTNWMIENNIKTPKIGYENRYGIVHRLDKPTSGVLVVAKSEIAYHSLKEQLQNKSMGRYYIGIIDKVLKNNIVVDKAISQSRQTKSKARMTLDKDGKNAKTSFVKLAISDDGTYELIKAKLYTGRTHQIRLHLHSLNSSILGDVLYGFKGKNTIIDRIFLHAYCLYLRHPTTNKQMVFKAPLHSDMKNFINTRFKKDKIDENIYSFDSISSNFSF
jgi:23S rRNA pseudouridine1911/1915/1917 synthase